MSVCLSVYLQAWKRSYFATLPQFLNLTTSTTRNSARLPQFWILTPSKTKQFCETSSIFEVDNIKNEAILRDFLQKWKVECRADGLVPMRFAIFPLHPSKVLRLPLKSDARWYEVLHLSPKIISANLKIWCSKMQPLSGNQRPDLLTTLMNMSLVLRLPRKMHLLQILFRCPTPAIVFGSATKPSRFCSHLTRCTIPCACHAKRRFNVQKWSEHIVFLHFYFQMRFAPQRRALFDSATSKSALELRCFVHFDFEMCFVPQRRALFHLSAGQLAPHPPL